MRTTSGWISLLCALLVGSGSAKAHISAETKGGVTLIPTFVQELVTLRVPTGNTARARDGSMTSAYTKTNPDLGSTFLNFHLDVATEAGPLWLSGDRIQLQAPDAYAPRESLSNDVTSYRPFDWFIDDGLLEQRGDSLLVSDKAILQFTIEVPRAGLDDLTLFVRSQRVGTVREIRARIATDLAKN